MDFSQHSILINQIFSDQENLSNEEYIGKLIKKVEILTELSNSLHLDQIQMPSWKTFSETIVIKICFHISSLFQIFQGTQLPFKQKDKKIIIFDEPSIFSLFRTITENYLTFYYLFIDGVSENEKHFRFLVYEYCGLHQRQSFKVTLQEHKQKKIDEGQHLEKLSKRIQEYSFFNKLEKNVQKKILSGVQPKLKTWKALIKEAQLNLGFDTNLYGFKSSYSHSEYLSLLQIKSSNYGFIPNVRKGHFVLFLTHMLICRIIMNLSDLFPSIKRHYNNLEEDMKIEIEFLSVNLGFDLSNQKNEK